MRSAVSCGSQELVDLDALAHRDAAVEADRRDREGVDLGVDGDRDHAGCGDDDGGGSSDAPRGVGRMLLDDTLAHQFADQIGDRRAVEARLLGERGAGLRPVDVHEAQQAREVALTHTLDRRCRFAHASTSSDRTSVVFVALDRKSRIAVW